MYVASSHACLPKVRRHGLSATYDVDIDECTFDYINDYTNSGLCSLRTFIDVLRPRCKSETNPRW